MIVIDDFTKKFLGLISIYIFIYIISTIAEKLIPKKQKCEAKEKDILDKTNIKRQH